MTDIPNKSGENEGFARLLGIDTARGRLEFSEGDFPPEVEAIHASYRAGEFTRDEYFAAIIAAYAIRYG